jgi:hypothetical protein
LALSKMASQSIGRRIAAEGKKLGRTDHLLPIKELTRTWSNYKTDTLGVDLDPAQLVEDFRERLAENLTAAEAMINEIKAEGLQLTELQVKEFAAWSQKKATLETNEKERKRHEDVLADFCGLRARSSQRATSLSLEEEVSRTLDSWHVWDKTCQVLATADPEELESWVANPDEFREHRLQTEISLGGQGPAWLRLDPGKLLTSIEKLKEAKEKQTLRNKRRKSDARKAKAVAEKEALLKEVEQGGQQMEELQQQIRDLEDELQASTAEMRSWTQSARTGRVSPGEAPRWRVTIWARQGIKHWFNPAKEPVGFIKPSILVVYGVHCRCENIDFQTGTWVEDEKFEVNGVLVIRKKGEPVPANIMASWRKLRHQHPELFRKDVLVWQQPAAVVDKVLWYWYQKLEASETRQMLRLVDTLRAGWSDEAQEVNFYFQQSQA